MYGLTKCVLWLVLYLFAAVQHTEGQIRSDDLISNWLLGSLRGHLTLRISDDEKPSFRKFVDDFVSASSFMKISSADKPVLDGREFMSDWYRRLDGVTILVSDITKPEKMQISFYDRKDGRGTAEAEQAFAEFKALSSRFRTYE